jgi:hypothetical protein
VLVVFLFAWLFFRFTGGTGCGLFGILALLFFFVLGNSTLHLISLIALPLLIFANEMLLMMRRSRATYLPAIAQVEGGGIKRGLTAAEAAIILEQPINRVLTLVIFGLLKKGVLRQTGAEPLTVELTEDFQVSEKLEPDQKENQRLKMAAKHQIVLHSYEHGFIDLIAENPNKPVHQIDFSKPMKKLIEHAAQRVKNFDLSDTRDYYRSIIKRALDEARSLEDEQQRNQNIDRNLEWILMNDGYRDTLDTRVRNRPYRYNPIWVRSPGYYSDRTGISKPLFGAGGGQSPSYGGTTSFSDVAASFAGWTENTFGSMADAISPGALQVEQSGGFVNLSGADKVTGDIFEALAKSSSSGGGSGGGCACACAGCACACACAGGGR